MRVVNRTALATRADVVVVGAHRRFDFEELKVAVQAVLRGRGADRRQPRRDRPDARRPVAGLRRPCSPPSRRRSARKASRVIGKPESAMYETVRDRLGAGRCLAVGDNLDTDIAGARRAGMDTALVLTGVTSRVQADAAEPRPTHVADSLGALVLGR